MARNLSTLWLAVATIGLTFIAADVLRHRPPAREAPVRASARALAADPEYYTGTSVIVETAAFERTEDQTTVVFRPFVPGPAAVACVMRHPVTAVPRRVLGTCAGRAGAGAPVRVVDCVPVE